MDAGTSDAEWYSLLTIAEAHWKPIIAAHYPASMYGAPVAMTTSDNKVWTVPSVNSSPLALVVLQSENGPPLVHGPYWSLDADYAMESAGTIRVTRGREFSTTPYARVISGPTTVDASTEPTIKPVRLNILSVYRACALDAGRGGLDDPSYYETMEREAAWGDPDAPGDVGLIGGLKAQQVVGGSPGQGIRDYWRPNG